MNSAEATVCLPWRATPDRLPAHDRCVRYWQAHGHPVVCGDSHPTRRFNRAQARNNAAAKARTDILIIADADTLPATHTQIDDAVAAAAATGNAVWPYDDYRLLPADAVNVTGLDAVTPLRRYSIAARPGGIIVIPRATYATVGGYDERFGAGWGYEDSAFMIACQTLVGIQQFPGTVYAFDHVAARHRDRNNRHRHNRYRLVSGKPEEMRRLLGLTRPAR